MPSNGAMNGKLFPEESSDISSTPLNEGPKSKEAQLRPLEIVWRNVVLFTYLHLAAIYGLYLMFSGQVMWQTYLFIVFIGILNANGITGGAHRLWAHRTYKAKLPLRIYLMLANCVGFQNHIFEWARDHRLHHKFSETNADPHNAKRGFFFAHMGWLMVRKDPEVILKGKTIDMNDLLRDPVVVFQMKYYIPMVVIGCFVIPTAIPWYYWGEHAQTALVVCGITRLVIALHITWLVNSAAHLYGDHPYDKNINPAESPFVVYTSFGEGFHNYHHTFPWDYKAGEWGSTFNFTKSCIDFWSRLGLAYDLKVVPQEVINRRRERLGDGSPVWYPEKLKEYNLKLQNDKNKVN